MATPPTVLADAPSADPAAAANPIKFPVVPLVVAVLAGVAIAALGIGTAVYVLARTGRIPLRPAAVGKTASPPVATHLVVLDPLVVNLADADGTAYLKISMALQVADAVDGKGSNQCSEKPSRTDGNEAMIAARDTALTVLGSESASALLAAGGKDRLKAELKAALEERNLNIKVVDVFFTDFLVQR